LPVYEYQCKECGHHFDKLKPMSKMDEKEECPKCSSNDIVRKLSVFAVGSGSKSGCSASQQESCGG